MAFAGYLKQSTAVDILIGPFIDDGDGKTAETGLTLDVEVSKNGQALANKSDATAPSHDAAGTVDGYYNCELDTTDTNTLGILTIVAHAAGFLPVRLDYQIVTANWWDTMCSTDQLDVNVTNIEGSDPTDQIRDSVVDDATRLDASSLNAIEGKVDTVDTNVDAILVDTGTTLDAALAVVDGNVDSILADTGTDGVALADGVITAAKIAANAIGASEIADAAIDAATFAAGAISAAAIATDAIGAAELAADAVAEIADAVWDEDIVAAHNTADTAGELLDTDLATILADTNELQTDDVPGLISALNDPTAAAIVNEWETQSQADPTGFHVNVLEVGGTAQTANDNGADINAILTDTNELQVDDVPGLIAALNDVSTADVNAQCDAAIETYHLDHLLAADYDPASKPGVATALLNELIESDGGVSRYTANALEEAPTGGSAPTVGEIADQVWDEATSGHVGAGTFGAQAGTDIDAILADTNELQTDDIPTSIAALPTATENRTEMDNNSTQLAAIVADTNELQTDDTPGTLSTIAGYLDTEIAAILADTGELQTDWANGGRLDLIIDAVLADTNELQSDDIPGLIAALNNLSAVNVNAEVVDVLSTDTQSLPGQGAPSATPTTTVAIMYLYKAFRNQIIQNATTLEIYADDGSTVDQKATISDDGTDYTRGEIGTGP